jgi:peptidoglycan/LPS O-acetylase OafA/YrhL
VGRYQTLDGLRGVAALAIALFHLAGWTNHRWILPHAWLAVDFFFMLSGFVIAHAYEKRLGSIGLLGFVRVRLIRLWPLIALSMVIGALAWAFVLHRGQALGYLWRGLLLVPQTHGQPYPLNAPAWSLFFELVANLAWVIVALRLDTRILLGAVLISGALAVGFDVPYAELGGAKAFLGGFPRVTFAYGLGVLCYRNQVRISLPAWLLALALIAVFWLPYTPAAVNLCIVGFVFPAILLAGAGSQSEGPLLKLGGDLSYPLYALHRPLGMILLGALGPHGPKAWVFVPVILGISWLALKLYDEPIRNVLTRSGRGRPEVEPAVTVL